MLISACLHKTIVIKNVFTELVNEIITLYSTTYKVYQGPALVHSAVPGLSYQSHPDART